MSSDPRLFSWADDGFGGEQLKYTSPYGIAAAATQRGEVGFAAGAVSR
jgi:hypothetical protein